MHLLTIKNQKIMQSTNITPAQFKEIYSNEGWETKKMYFVSCQFGEYETGFKQALKEFHNKKNKKWAVHDDELPSIMKQECYAFIEEEVTSDSFSSLRSAGIIPLSDEVNQKIMDAYDIWDFDDYYTIYSFLIHYNGKFEHEYYHALADFLHDFGISILENASGDDECFDYAPDFVLALVQMIRAIPNNLGIACSLNNHLNQFDEEHQ